MKIFVVIPLFNEESHIAGVIKGVSAYKLPIVVVDDGSGDGSAQKVKALKAKDVTILEHKVNLGKGAAMKTGAEYAFNHGADAVIFMDSDGQHNPDDLPKFIEAVGERKYEIAFGSRNLNFGLPLVRYLGNKFASVFVRVLFGIYVSDLVCGFRSITRSGYEKIKWESRGYGVETEMIVRTAKARIKSVEVPVDTIYHNSVKGVTLLDAFGILLQVVKWRLTL